MAVIRFKPKDEYFFDCFDKSSGALLEGTRILKDYVENNGDPVPRLEQLNEVEAKGDAILNTIVDRLNTSFITPFDREDIYALAKGLNRIIDHIQGTMEKVVVYKAGQPQDTNIKQMVLVLEQATKDIQEAVGNLRHLNQKYRDVLEACDRIRSLESEGDFLYRRGLAELFEKGDAIEIIKWKEILEHLETTLDYCEDVANVLKGVAVKYV